MIVDQVIVSVFCVRDNGVINAVHPSSGPGQHARVHVRGDPLGDARPAPRRDLQRVQLRLPPVGHHLLAGGQSAGRLPGVAQPVRGDARLHRFLLHAAQPRALQRQRNLQRPPDQVHLRLAGPGQPALHPRRRSLRAQLHRRQRRVPARADAGQSANTLRDRTETAIARIQPQQQQQQQQHWH